MNKGRLVKLTLMLVVASTVLSACSIMPAETVPLPTSTAMPLPTATPEPTATMASIPSATTTPGPSLPLGTHHHWQGIIPGESTMDDVQAKLGPRDRKGFEHLPGAEITTDEYRILTWVYKSFEGRMPEICQKPCNGQAWVYFVDDTAVMIEFLFFSNEPTVGELVAMLGEPEFKQGHPAVWDVSPSEGANLTERGVDWFRMARLWAYAYPNSGVFAIVGPQYETEHRAIAVYYPLDSDPPADVPITNLYLFAPMTMSEYQDSELAFDWVKELIAIFSTPQ